MEMHQICFYPPQKSCLYTININMSVSDCEMRLHIFKLNAVQFEWSRKLYGTHAIKSAQSHRV